MSASRLLHRLLFATAVDRHVGSGRAVGRVLGRTLVACAVAGASSAASLAAHAQTVPERVDALSVIGSAAVTGAVGVVAVNQASGLDNVQANQAVVTTGAMPIDLTASAQGASANARATNAASVIASNAFSNASGVIQLNQSAGVANLQRNSALIGAAPGEAEIVSDGVLSATTANGSGLARSVGSHDVQQASIGAGAFANVNGVLQINQTAGAGNVSSNSFVLRPPAGTFF
ncbi:hypothetical protein PXJ20_07465 [Paraburkholderia sp. A1RI_3L]|uniref:hypothetical protein n=1 Tax=Paraburkholderia TaxID=1822464 RepID=UPI003B7FE783